MSIRKEKKEILMEPKHLKLVEQSSKVKLLDFKQTPTVDHLVHYRNMFATPDAFIRRKVDYSKMRVANEKYRKESERRLTFKSFPPNRAHLVNDLVKSGFFCVENSFVPDQVKCIFCQGTLENWTKNDVPMKRHKFSYPTCPFIISLNVANEAETIYPSKLPDIDPIIAKHGKDSIQSIDCTIVASSLDPLGSFNKMNYFDADWRRETFVNDIILVNLSIDGLFVETKGMERFLVCCWCSKTTEILDGAEHLGESILHRKDCRRNEMERNSGDIKSDTTKEFCDVEYAVSTQEIEARTETKVVHQLIGKDLTMKISKEDIKSVIERRLKKEGKDFESTYEFLRSINNYKREGHTSSEVHDSIASVTLSEYQCVVCLDKVVQVIFLPCGHMKTCGSCSEAMVNCPVCRVLIVRRVTNMRFNDG